MSRSPSDTSSPLNLIGNADQLAGMYSATGSGGGLKVDSTTKSPKRSIEDLGHVPHGNRDVKRRKSETCSSG